LALASAVAGSCTTGETHHLIVIADGSCDWGVVYPLDSWADELSHYLQTLGEQRYSTTYFSHISYGSEGGSDYVNVDYAYAPYYNYTYFSTWCGGEGNLGLALSEAARLTQENPNITNITDITDTMVVVLRYRRGRDTLLQTAELARVQALGARVVIVDALYGSSPAALLGAGIGVPRQNHIAITDFSDDTTPIAHTAQALLGLPGRVCTYASPGLVHTYDGNTYGFAGVGDYVLARAYDLSAVAQNNTRLPGRYLSQVTIRNSWCKSGDKEEAHSGHSQTPCTTAVAVSFSSFSLEDIYTFAYDAPSKTLVATYNGEPYQLSLIADNDNDTVYAYRQIPGDTIHVIAYDHWQIVNISFIQGRVFVSHWPHPKVPSIGLCGVFDGCPDNDTITIDGLPTTANESAITWLLSPESSPISSTNFQNPNFVYDYIYETRFPLTSRKPVIDVPSKISDKCSGDELGHGWLADMCNFDRAVFQSDIKPALKELPRMMCSEYCQNKLTPYSGIANEPSLCADYCDFQMLALVSSQENFNPHTKYSAKELPVVPVTAGSTNDQAALFFPLGGEYTFSVGAYDCCTTEDTINRQNVTITVDCAGSFEVKAGDNITYALDAYTFPQVVLDAELKVTGANTENIHVSWRFIHWPRDPEGFLVEVLGEAPPPAITNSFSLQPSFFPTDVGNYTLEVVAFDGCMQAFSYINVEIRCVNVSYYVDYTGGSYGANVWTTGYYYPSWEWYIFQQCYLSLDAEMFTYAVEVTPQYALPPYFSWNRVDDNTWSIDLHAHKEYNTTTTVSDITVTEDDEDGLDDGFPQMSADEFERRWEIDNYKRTTDQWTRTITTVRDHIWAEVHVIECYIWKYGYSDYLSLQAHPKDALSPSDRDPFLLGDAVYQPYFTRHLPDVFPQCEGIYSVSLSSRTQIACSNFTHNTAIEFTCRGAPIGPLAHTLTPTLDVVFDYPNRQFPTVQLEGRDTSDMDGRHDYINYWWSITKAPSNQTVPINGGGVGYMDLPPVPGAYTVELFVSDRCTTDTDTIDVTAKCPGLVTIVPCVLSQSAVHWNYSVVSDNDVWISVNGSASNGTDSVLYYTWEIYQFPARPLDVIMGYTTNPYDYLSGTLNTRPHATMSPYSAGQYAVRVTGDDGCRSASTQCIFNVVCDNDIHISVGTNTATDVWGGYPTGFPPVMVWNVVQTTADITEQWVTLERQIDATTWTPAWWVLKSPADSNSTSLYPGRTGHYRATVAVTDGCTARAASVEFDVVCPANTLVPYIQAAQGKYWYEGQALVTLDASASTATLNTTLYPLDYAWHLNLTNGTQMLLGYGPTAHFAADTMGDYYVYLTVMDGCTQATDVMHISVECLNNDFRAVAKADVDTVTWTGKKFPLVTVNGASSSMGTTNLTADSFHVEWVFLEAPPASMFKGLAHVVSVTTVGLNQTIVGPTESFAPLLGYSPYMMHQATTSTLVYHHESVAYYSVLRMIPNSNPDANAINDGWVARFRPDVPGFYKLQLTMTPTLFPCRESVSTVTIDAICNTPPSMVFTPPVNATVNRRVNMDASASTDRDRDALSFQWRLTECTPNSTRDVTVDQVLNHLGPHASWVPQYSGSFCLYLTISDGCSTVSTEWVMDVKCPRELELPPAMNSEYKFDGIGQQMLMIDLAEGDAKKITNPRTGGLTPFLWQYDWELISYTSPFTSAAPSLRATVLALPLALALLLVLF
jgi:hypothetical protein